LLTYDNSWNVFRYDGNYSYRRNYITTLTISSYILEYSEERNTSCCTYFVFCSSFLSAFMQCTRSENYRVKSTFA
jgi:hypothetical protein